MTFPTVHEAECEEVQAVTFGDSAPLNDAVYEPGRGVIFAVNAGYIFKLDATTGEKIASARFTPLDWGDMYLAYDPDGDKLWAADWLDYAAIPKVSLFRINPETLAVEDSWDQYLNQPDNLQLIAGYLGDGIRQLMVFAGRLYVLYRTQGNRVVGMQLDLADPPNNAARSALALHGIFHGAMCNDGEAVWTGDENTNPNPNRQLPGVPMVSLIGPSGITGKNIYAMDYNPRNGYLYWSNNNDEVIKQRARGTGDAATLIDLARPNANPLNIAVNPYNFHVYVPLWKDNTVAIINPLDDTFQIVSGFDSPFDVVFTPTKAWAVQHGSPGLKEIVTVVELADVGPVPPARVIPTPQTAALLAYYSFEETFPGPWVDSKNGNDLIAQVMSEANNTVQALAQQADGKILIGGGFTAVNGATINRIARINDTGSIGLDTAFTPGTGANAGSIFGIGIDSTGQIVIGGSFSSYNGTARTGIARLNSDGTLDATLDTETAFGAPGANNTVQAVLIDADDKILIAGAFTSVCDIARNRIARIDNNLGVRAASVAGAGTGYTVDLVGVASTGGTGTGATFDVTWDGADGISDVAVNNPGTGYTAGDVLTLTAANADATVNVDGVGIVDLAFDATTGANGTIQAMALQADGKIIIAGAFTSYGGSTRNRIARVNTDGTLDTGFNPGTGANGTVNRVALQSDGKVVIGGDFTTINAVTRTRVARLNTNGTLDTGFDAGAIFTASVKAVAVDADGKILVGATSATDQTKRLARLLSTGTVDTTFTNPTLGVGQAGNSSTVQILLVQPDGKIVAGGDFSGFGGPHPTRIGRVNTDGSVDYTFNLRAIIETVSGINGNAAKFSGDTNTRAKLVTAANSTNLKLDPDDGFTFTFWYKPETLANPISGNQPFSLFPVAVGGQHWAVQANLSGTTAIQFYMSDGTRTTTIATVSGLVAGNWHFFRVWLDPADRHIRAQMNMGTVVVATGEPLDFVEGLAESQLSMTKYHEKFTLDEMAIYRGVLSDAQAAVLYGAGTPPAYPAVPLA